jgi:type IV pilus assembly protein PilQ
VEYFPIRTQDTIDYKEIPAVLSLKVSPTVSADNQHVTMRVEVTDDKSLPAKQESSGSVQTSSEPGRTEKKIMTTLMVRTGDTVVIGGIYQKDSQLANSGVPWVKDIPILGWLFKAEYEKRQKTELLIFLTPTVVNTLEKRGEGQ